MRICPRCEINKNDNDFHKHKIRGLQTYCKKCQKVRDKNTYQKNKKHIIELAEIRRLKTREWHRHLKQGVSCECGEDDPRCLDYHHRNTNEKLYNVSDMVKSNHSRKKILEEIKKCDLICSNCHRKLTIEEY